MKRGVVVTLAAAVLLTQSGLAFAQSSPVRKPGRQMTCGDFLLVEDTVKPEMVYWAATRDARGGHVNAVIDVDAIDRMVPVLVERCRQAVSECAVLADGEGGDREAREEAVGSGAGAAKAFIGESVHHGRWQVMMIVQHDPWIITAVPSRPDGSSRCRKPGRSSSRNHRTLGAIVRLIQRRGR